SGLRACVHARPHQAPILADERLVRPGVDVQKVVDELIAPQWAAEVIGGAPLARTEP
ncbi:hypothetical protein ACV340_34485, partial [Pseudomonas aeruginosa]